MTSPERRDQAEKRDETGGEQDVGHVGRPALKADVVVDGTRRTVFFLPETV